MNEHVVFHSAGSADVKAKIEELGVVLLRANDLGRDPNIPRTVSALGREGYPTNAVYPGRGKPLLLPEVLTQQTVIDALNEAAKRLKQGAGAPQVSAK